MEALSRAKLTGVYNALSGGLTTRRNSSNKAPDTGCHEEIDITHLAVDTRGHAMKSNRAAPAPLLRSGDGNKTNHQRCASRAGAAISIIRDLVYGISCTNRYVL
jgi:hypothetical protein